MRQMNGPNKNPEYRETQTADAWKLIDQFFLRELAGK
jgi:hypothetical protein